MQAGTWRLNLFGEVLKQKENITAKAAKGRKGVSDNFV